MGRFVAGEVVVVKFPFSDFSTFKRVRNYCAVITDFAIFLGDLVSYVPPCPNTPYLMRAPPTVISNIVRDLMQIKDALMEGCHHEWECRLQLLKQGCPPFRGQVP